jgi:transcription initiation factor TFIIIB Brf1 subunit/transcription initiation factor TFIIB
LLTILSLSLLLLLLLLLQTVCACAATPQTQEYKTLKGRSNRAVYAACIFVAGKRENSHRTFKEICAVMGPDIDKVDIGRCFTAIDK